MKAERWSLRKMMTLEVKLSWSTYMPNLPATSLKRVAMLLFGYKVTPTDTHNSLCIPIQLATNGRPARPFFRSLSIDIRR